MSTEIDAVRTMPCCACEAMTRRIRELTAQLNEHSTDTEWATFDALRHSRGSAAKGTVVSFDVAGNGSSMDQVPLCGVGWGRLVPAGGHAEEAGAAGTEQRAAFEKRYGLDLRRVADDVALVHEPPLGIRGLARRLSETHDIPFPCDTDLDACERGELFGWVGRAMSSETARHGWKHWATLLPEQRDTVALHRASTLGQESLGDDSAATIWALCEASAGPRRKRLKLDPDLADGDHWTICDRPDANLLDAIGIWMDHAEVGDYITIELVEMTDAEVEALPDV